MPVKSRFVVVLVTWRLPTSHQFVPPTSMSYTHVRCTLVVKGEKTHQTAQILAPRASFPVCVKVVEQENENDEDSHQTRSSDEPPSPPRLLSPFEEFDWCFRESSNSSIWLVTITSLDLTYRNIRLLVNSLLERLRTVQNTYAQHQAHKKPTNMREIVKTR